MASLGDDKTLSCLKARINGFCETFNSKLLMQSHTNPEKFIQSPVVQSEIGSYLIAKALSEDPNSFTEACNGDAIERLFQGKNAIPIGEGDERFETLDKAKIIVDQIKEARLSGKAGGSSSRKTKKKGKKSRNGRKQRGGALTSELIKSAICYALTAAIFYGVLQMLGMGAAVVGLPQTLTGVSGALADIMIQGNLIKNACEGTGAVAMSYIGSFVGMTQTCETIALENEVQLTNLTAYVASVLGVTVGSLGTITFNSVYDVVCGIVRQITQVCGTSTEYASQSFAQLLTGKINELALVKLGGMTSGFPVLDSGVIESNNPEAITQGTIKTLVDRIIEDPSNAKFKSGDMVSVITNLQDPEAMEAFTLPAVPILKKVGDVSNKMAVEDALYKNGRFMSFFRDCVKYPGCTPPAQSRAAPTVQSGKKESADETETETANERSTLGRAAMAPTRNPMSRQKAHQLLGGPARSSQPQRPALTDAQIIDIILGTTADAELVARREEALQMVAENPRLQQEIARRQAVMEEAERRRQEEQQQVPVASQQEAAQQQATQRSATAEQREAEGETKSDEPNEAGKRTRTGGRRRRRTSKAKKHHKKGKKAHKSRKGRKGKKENRKTKKHHKKAKKAHRKSRKH